MNANELTECAKNFLISNYGFSLVIPIRINNRFKTTLGSFNISNKIPENIEIAGFLLEYGAKEVIIDVLYHECIHYALFIQGRNYHDGSDEFEGELRKLGVSSSGTNRVGRYVKYKCTNCNEIYVTNKLDAGKNPSKYKSSCCKSRIQLIGEVIYNGTEASE